MYTQLHIVVYFNNYNFIYDISIVSKSLLFETRKKGEIKEMKKISMILLSIALAVSLAAMPAMAAEETEVKIASAEEKAETAEPEAKPAVKEGEAEKEEATIIEKTAEKVQEVIEEAIEAVKESAETVKEKVEGLKEKAEEEAVHAEMELDAKLSEEKEEEYNVSTPVFQEVT